jgi:hypothetical protein
MLMEVRMHAAVLSQSAGPAMAAILRMLLPILVLAVASANVYAQSREVTPSSACWAVAIKGPVLITKTDGSVQRGTLVCLGATDIVLAGAGSIPLDSVTRIDTPRDGILDGVLKGASVGLVVLALCVPHCTAEPVLRVTAAYATFGGILDALQGNNKQIFRRDMPAASIAWKVRF